MTPLLDDRLVKLDALHLGVGSHDSWDDGACAMEAVAWLAGETHSDHPQCVSGVLGAFVRSWNDALGAADRDRLLKPLLPRLVDTAADEATETRRAWMCLDWLVRDETPRWLSLAGLDDHAETLAGLPEFREGMDVPSVRPAIEAATYAADAARAAAAAADAGRFARGAAWAAAWDAAWDAAADTADAAAGAAGATEAAWAAGRFARGAAWAAAGAVEATWAAAWAGAWDGAADALEPTVIASQDSAVALIDRMIGANQ